MRLIKGLITAALALSLLAVPAGALAKSRDRNHDRIPDKWEAKHHLSTRANVARQDPDKDGLSNLSEFRHNTDPQKADTDGDGVGDGTEVRDNTNPDNPDTNGDGITDGNEVSGAVVSFDAGVLTIQPSDANTSPVSGTVNDQTQIECSGDSAQTTTQQPATATAASDGSDDSSTDGSGDNSGSGTTTPTTTSSDDGANHDSTAPTTTSGNDASSQDGSDDGTDNSCTSADLKPGAQVHEAKLMQAADGSMVFTKIELIPAA